MAKKVNEVLDPTNPIAAAVLPLKSTAQDRAEKHAREVITGVTSEMLINNNNVNAFAPYPRAFNMSRAEYHKKKAKHDLVISLTKRVNPNDYVSDSPRVMCEKSCERFVAEARTFAAAQYDAFVFKLTHKIGATTSAVLDGNHVWSTSFLTVVKADSTREVWKTQTIVNHTKFGMPYLQWPSRKVKA